MTLNPEIKTKYTPQNLWIMRYNKAKLFYSHLFFTFIFKQQGCYSAIDTTRYSHNDVSNHLRYDDDQGTMLSQKLIFFCESILV